MSFLIVIGALGIAGASLYMVYQNQNGSSVSPASSASGQGTGGGGSAPSPLPPVSGGSGNYYASDGSITGSQITQHAETWPPATSDDKVWDICAAVATAEGYHRGPGTAPFDLNNPGDVSPGDEAGEATCGAAEQHGGSAIIHFCKAEGGWRALYHKFARIVAGQSQVYPADWTWEQISQQYAGNSANWLASVVGYLGVDPSSTPQEYVNS